jgi:glycolate oxidase iron-sulfur subunit
LSLIGAVRIQEDRLLACVHCGFCLPACPTYTRLGNEADSPRGRLHLMRAVAEGRLEASSGAFQEHIDRCLGCRACETVCPSGVEYGLLLEEARGIAAHARPPGALARALPALFGSRLLRRPALALARVLRASGLPRFLARVLPRRGLAGSAAFGMAMLAASAPVAGLRSKETESADAGAEGFRANRTGGATGSDRGRVALLGGCVQEGLFSRVNQATRRVLAVNGAEVVEVPGQGCCGALHAHSGDLEGARRLARRNIRAFEASGEIPILVNAAGCGAAMKEYGHLLASDPDWSGRATLFARRVRDLTEFLATVPLRVGGAVPLSVTWDAPCHLLHAQRIADPPLALLRTIPELRMVPLRGASECCGGAGIYAITHPELGGAIGGDKVSAVRESGAALVATANPGCMMQIGAGLLSERSEIGVVHPVELLDESYRRGGLYGGAA